MIAPSQPELTFGIGTTGNNNLSPNGFNGDLVNNVDFGISVGDATTSNLVNKDYLVRDSALFRFGGFSGYTANDIQGHVVFGLGSRPDAVITVPEPGNACLAAIGGIAVLGWRVRRRSAWLRTALRSTAAAVVAGIVVVALLFAAPARAAPVSVADWNAAPLVLESE